MRFALPHLAARPTLVCYWIVERFAMSDDVGADQLAIIRIDGMHCHKCEQTVQRALMQHPGVHEVEVDFNSAQASVLFDHGKTSLKTLTDAITEVGYHVAGFATRDADRTQHN
jgi:copper chaperone CopZ